MIDSARRQYSENEVTQVRAQLSRVLKSDFFRGSQRCSRFLQYSVQNVLLGCSSEDLKERVIGVEVFHRDANYDTAQDNTVRVTANEVRKRLAQYYGQSRHGNPVIELPAGAYAVSFRWESAEASHPESESATEPSAGHQGLESALPTETPNAINAIQDEVPLPAHSQSWSRSTFLSVPVLLLMAAAALFYIRQTRRSDVVQDVWASVLDSEKPVVVCVAQPVAYRPVSDIDNPTGPNDHMVKLSNAFVGMGDAYALASIASFMGSRGKAWYILPSSETSFRNLTTGSIVLIGSFSNEWTGKLADRLRFSFVTGPPNRIVDRDHPGAGWTIPVSPEWTAAEDYAVISKFKSQDTGQTIIALAGATNFGTEAAGKFLTDTDLLSSGMQDAPRDWKNMNFQIVLHTRVVGHDPERPTVVAKYFW